MDIGRAQNADPRWLLPLICRRGHITKQEIGAIRIAQDETLLEIDPNAAQRFSVAIRKSAGQDENGEVQIVPAGGPPQRGPSQQRRGPPQAGAPRRAGPGGPPRVRSGGTPHGVRPTRPRG